MTSLNAYDKWQEQGAGYPLAVFVGVVVVIPGGRVVVCVAAGRGVG